MLRKSELSNFVFSSILPVKNPLPRGLYGTKPMPSSSSVGITSCFRRPHPQRVFALESGDRLHRVGATNRLYPCLGNSEVLHLACWISSFTVPATSSIGTFGIDPVLIEQVDGLDPQPLERAFDGLLDVLRPAIQAR